MGLLTTPRPRHRATTAHAQAMFPYVAEAGLGTRGAWIGHDLFGAPFYFDPIALYNAGIGVTDPNILILGELGKGKSALAKVLCRRLSVFGYQGVYVSNKPEVAPLARAFGVSMLRPTPGGNVRLNPFDERLSATAAGDPPRDRALLLRSVIALMLRRSLTTAEERAVSECVYAVDAGTPLTLPRLQAALEKRAIAGGVVAQPLADALWNFTHGPARGLFDGATSADVDFDAPFIGVDLSAMLDPASDDRVLAVVLAMTAAWLYAVIARTTRRRLLLLDELWRVLREPSTVEWLRAQWKLSRTFGTANVAILHRLSDLDAAVNPEVARTLMADCQTKILFAQPAEERPALLRLGLSESEADYVVSLPPYWAVWMVGDRMFVVRLDVQDSERELIDTDAAMRGPTADTGAAA